MFAEYLIRLQKKQHLTQDEAEDCLQTIFREELKDEDIAALLVALAEKGETREEIIGFCRALLANAVALPLDRASIDLCGTGGSGLNRFNISTSAAFILAAGGVKVIKHGNKGSRRANGSFDLLEELDCGFDFSPEMQAEIFTATNLCFVFARKYHPAMKRVVGARRLAGRRTIFNIIGPLCNPVQPLFQIIGTSITAQAEVVAAALSELGRKKCLVFSGKPGIDEISISGETVFFEIDGTAVSRGTLIPEDFGIERVPYDTLPGGDAPENSLLFRTLLEGRGDKHLKEMVCLNAGAAFYCAGKVPDIKEGYSLSCSLLESGNAKASFEVYAGYS